MKKMKIGLVGAHGRMGLEIAKVIEANKNCELTVSIGRGDKIDTPAAKNLNVWIDFSAPDVFAEVLKVADKNKTPVVCGTTGFSAKEKALLKKYSSRIPLLWASNMSMGVAVLNEALKVFSAVSGFDFQVEEFHHHKKKDKPSGTAITIQENLEKVVGRKLPDPLAIRGGGIYGIHKVYAMSDEEVLMFEHSALNRTVFAKGAVTAALFLAKQKPGLYTIRDVLYGKQK